MTSATPPAAHPSTPPDSTAGVTVREAPWDHPDGVTLRARQQAEIRAHYGPDSEPGVPPSAGDIAVFLIASAADGEPVGCGALRRLGPDSAELKRMFVAPEWRGRGVSVALLAALERYAREHGWPVLRLETGPKQVEAIRFYTRSGYAPIPNFGDYAGHPDSLCYERVLEIV